MWNPRCKTDQKDASQMRQVYIQGINISQRNSSSSLAIPTMGSLEHSHLAQMPFPE